MRVLLFSLAVILVAVSPMGPATAGDNTLHLVESPDSGNGLGIVENTIAKEGVFILFDGGSLFTFHKDGTFNMIPAGIQGRVADGVWRATGKFYTIEGAWGWLNMGSDEKEKKRMVMYIQESGAQADQITTNTADLPTKVYRTYFFIESLETVKDFKEQR